MRADNMIRYESPDMAGLRLYGEYSNGVDGDDAVPSSQRDRFAALGAQYRRGPLRVVFVADNYFYERGSSPYNRDDSQTYNLGIRWKLDDLTLYGAYQYGHNVEKVGNQMTRHKDTKNTLCGNEGFDSHAVVLGATHEVLAELAVAKARHDRCAVDGVEPEEFVLFHFQVLWGGPDAAARCW